MAIYKLEINSDADPDREAGLQKVVEDYNLSIELPPDSELPPEQGTPLTVEQYLQLVLDNAVESYKMQYLAKRGNVIAVKFAKASDADRMSVEAVLAAIPEGSFQPKAK